MIRLVSWIVVYFCSPFWFPGAVNQNEIWELTRMLYMLYLSYHD